MPREVVQTGTPTNPSTGTRAVLARAGGWYDRDSTGSEKKLSDQADTSAVPSYGLPASGAPSNRYDVLRGIYNYKSSNTRILEQGLSRAMAGGLTSHLVIGDSVSAGAIAQTGTGWLFDRLRAWPMAMRDQLGMLGVPGAGTGIIRHVDGAVGIDSRWTSSAGWVGDVGYAHTLTLNAWGQLIPDRDGTIFDYLYFDSGLGTFTIAVDGVTVKTVTANGAAGWKIARCTGLSIKANVTQIKVTLTATNGGGLYAAGGSVWTPNGGLLVHNPSQSASTASGTGLAAWSDYTAGSGLGTIYRNVAGRKRTVTDGASTAGSSTLTSATGAFTADDVGKPIGQVQGSSGPMFAGECYIGAFLTSTTVTIYSGLTGAAILASNTASSQTVTIGRDPDCVHIALGANDIAALAAADSTITAAITTIRNDYPNSDCILHLPHEMSTTLISTIRATAYQKAMYALADTLDVPLYDWRDRVGSFAAGQANGSYGDNLAHLTPATEADLGSQLGWILGGGGAQPQTTRVPVVDADLTNKKYVDGKTAGTKVSALTAASALTGSDVQPVVNGGATKKVTLDTQVAYIRTRLQVTNASVADQTGFATDTYLAGSNVVIPAGGVQAKTIFRVKFEVAKTAAGTGTPIITLRAGTLGTTADPSIVALTFGFQTAVIDEGEFELEYIFRTVGSGTSAAVKAWGKLWHRLVTTGLNVTAVYTKVLGTSAGFNSTTQTNYGISVNAGGSAAWTITAAEAEIKNLP